MQLFYMVDELATLLPQARSLFFVIPSAVGKYPPQSAVGYLAINTIIGVDITQFSALVYSQIPIKQIFLSITIS